MNDLRKARIKAVLKYTWPFYIISALIVGVLLYFIFGITHRTPTYKTLTLFVSGEVKDVKKLKNDMLEKYKDNQLKSVTCISSKVTDSTYFTKLTIPGYSSADVLIIPNSILEGLNVSAFALDINDELYNSYYSGLTLFSQDSVNYGIRIDKEKTKEYFNLPDENCYMVLNGKSVNTGKYSLKQIEEHNNALRVLQEWGM